MELEIWLAYLGAILILMSTPGPSHVLILSNSMKHGFMRAVFTGMGDLTANFIQMIIASVGLVSLIQNSREIFVIIKWAGVAYLVFLGIKLIVSKKTKQLNTLNNNQSRSNLYWQGFVTSAVNPKAVIFFAALFPQFINTSEALINQFVILSATYLIVDATILSCYAIFAEWMSNKWLKSRQNRLNWVSGAFLIVAAILLGLKDIHPG